MRASLLAALAVTFAAVPAVASAAPPQSAQRFADAALRFERTVKGLEDEIKAAYEEANIDACERALRRKPPERALDAAVELLTAALFKPIVTTALPPAEQMLRDLDAIPTNDPALRSGRSSWRESVALYKALPMMDDPCGALERWSKTRWRPDARPEVPGMSLDDIVAKGEVIERKARRAVRRLRQLGISRRAAERFSGEGVADAFLPDDVLEDL